MKSSLAIAAICTLQYHGQWSATATRQTRQPKSIERPQNSNQTSSSSSLSLVVDCRPSSECVLFMLPTYIILCVLWIFKNTRRLNQCLSLRPFEHVCTTLGVINSSVVKLPFKTRNGDETTHECNTQHKTHAERMKCRERESERAKNASSKRQQAYGILYVSMMSRERRLMHSRSRGATEKWVQQTNWCTIYRRGKNKKNICIRGRQRRRRKGREETE